MASEWSFLWPPQRDHLAVSSGGNCERRRTMDSTRHFVRILALSPPFLLDHTAQLIFLAPPGWPARVVLICESRHSGREEDHEKVERSQQY